LGYPQLLEFVLDIWIVSESLKIYIQMGVQMPDIARNVYKIKQQIAGICQACHRNPEEITLIAVTKTHPAEFINEALRSGVSHFGENKVQDSLRKVPMLSCNQDYFHFIGHLQSNKINQLLSIKPRLIHSIDSLHLAEKLNRALGNRNKTQDILIQVNVTDEEQKSGVTFENARDTIWKIAAYPCLRVVGLMTIGKLHPNPEISRPYFKQLKELFDEINAHPENGLTLKYLSMGMSHDWQIAIQEGSNMIRIGSAIFGERHYGDDR